MENASSTQDDRRNGIADAAEGYQIPKREVIADLLLPGESPRQVRLYLSESAERRSGPERPSDLLNGTGAFIPACDMEGRWMLLNRDSIVALSVPRSEELEPEYGLELELDRHAVTVHRVELCLTDGHTLTGSLRYVRPEGQRRPLDFLNACDPFFAVHEGDHVHLVNRGHVLVVFPE